MSTEQEIFANMSPNETPSPVSVERSGAPDPMTASVQTPTPPPSTRTSMGEADARPTVLARDLVKRSGTLNPAPEEKKTPTEKKLNFNTTTSAKKGNYLLMNSYDSSTVDNTYKKKTNLDFTARRPAIAATATATKPTINDPYDHDDHLTSIHKFLPITIDNNALWTVQELVSRLERIVAVDAHRMADKLDLFKTEKIHFDTSFYQLRCLTAFADPSSPFVRAVTLVEKEKEMRVRPRIVPVQLPSLASEQAARDAASKAALAKEQELRAAEQETRAQEEKTRALQHAAIRRLAFEEWKGKLLEANGGLPPGTSLTLKVEFMRGTPIEKLVTFVGVTLLLKKHRHPGLFFARFSNEPDKTYAVSLAHTRGRTPLIALVTGRRKAKVSEKHFAQPLMARFLANGLSKTKARKAAEIAARESATSLFHSLGNRGPDPYKPSEVCDTALVDGVETCASAAVGRTALWARTEEGELYWGSSDPPSQNARDPASMTADDHRRIELVRKKLKEQNELVAARAAAEREDASAPEYVPQVAVAPEPEPEPEPPVTSAQVAQALIRLREVVRRHIQYFNDKARNLEYDSGHKLNRAVNEGIDSDGQDKWITAATYLSSILLLDRTESGENRHGVITTTPEEQAEIKFICSLTPCFSHFCGIFDQSPEDADGNHVPTFKPGVTLENCDTPRCHFSDEHGGTRCSFNHSITGLLGPNGRIELGKDKAWFCFNRGLLGLRNNLQKGEECLGLRPSDVGPGIPVTDHSLRCAIRAETDARRTLADFLVPERVQRPDRHARRNRSPADTAEVLELSAEDVATVRAVVMRAEEPEHDERLFAEWEAECEDLDEARLPIPPYDEWLNSRSLRKHTEKLLDAPRFTVGTHERPASKGGRGNRGSKAHLGTVNGFSAKPTRRRNGASVWK